MENKMDILNRQDFVDRLISLINQISINKKGCTFAIEGEWGIGKSFILDMLEEQISEIQSEKSADNKYFVFNYNCWKYDYYKEPSIAIVAAMLDKAEEENAILSRAADGHIKDGWKFAKDTLGVIAGKFVENKIGVNVIEVVKEIQGNGEERIKERNSFDSLLAFKETLEDTRKHLEKIAERKSIIIMVDELDRCSPEYAIKILERLHHLFNEIENIIVIIAIDSKQLEYSIKQIYGDNTNVEKYLKKFILFSVRLDIGNVSYEFIDKYNNFSSKFNISKGDSYQDDLTFINELIKKLFKDIDIRTQEKLMEKAEIIHSILCNTELDFSVLCFEIMYLVFTYKSNSYNLEWVANINISTYSNIEQIFTKEFIEFLKYIENNIVYQRISKFKNISDKKVVLLDKIADKIFWYFSSLYNKQEGEINGNYLSENYLSISEEVNFVHEFVEMAKIIK